MNAESRGDYGRAAVLYDESLARYRQVGDKFMIAAQLHNLGDLARGHADYERATALLQESIAVFREVGNNWGIATSLQILALVAQHQGDYSRAALLFEKSLSLSRELGDKLGIAQCLEGLAGVAGLQGQPGQAARLFGAATTLRKAINAPLAPADRADYDRMLAAARAQVDEATWAAAWVEGQAMTPEQAIAALDRARLPEQTSAIVTAAPVAIPEPHRSAARAPT